MVCHSDYSIGTVDCLVLLADGRTLHLPSFQFVQFDTGIRYKTVYRAEQCCGETVVDVVVSDHWPGWGLALTNDKVIYIDVAGDTLIPFVSDWREERDLCRPVSDDALSSS